MSHPDCPTLRGLATGPALPIYLQFTSTFSSGVPLASTINWGLIHRAFDSDICSSTIAYRVGFRILGRQPRRDGQGAAIALSCPYDPCLRPVPASGRGPHHSILMRARAATSAQNRLPLSYHRTAARSNVLVRPSDCCPIDRPFVKAAYLCYSSWCPIAPVSIVDHDVAVLPRRANPTMGHGSRRKWFWLDA